MEEEKSKIASFLDYVVEPLPTVIHISSTNRDDWLQAHVFAIFAAFHSFYEALKLDKRDAGLMPFVAEPLYVFSR